MASQNGSDFPSQTVALGDLVYFYENPLVRKEPILGWVCRRPGVNTVSVLVFSPDSGFVEKPSVRHIDDPGLTERAAWRAWGGWDFHPSTLTLKKLDSLMPQLVGLLARQQSKRPESE
jgi:hypothetical protein